MQFTRKKQAMNTINFETNIETFVQRLISNIKICTKINK